MSIEAMKLALEALEQARSFSEGGTQKAQIAIAALRAAIEQLHAENEGLREAINKFVSEELTFGQRYTNAGQGLLDALTGEKT